MDSEISKKIIEYLDQTRDFVLEQAPELCRQIMRFDKIAAYLGSIVLLIIAGIAIYFSIKFAGQHYERSYERPVFHMPVWFATIIFIPIAFFQICSNISDLIQMEVAPKYYLLKRFK